MPYTGIHIENVELSLLRPDRASAAEPPAKAAYVVPHNHFCMELFVCFEGRLCLQAQREELWLSSGEAALIPSTEKHCANESRSAGQWCSLLFTCLRLENRYGWDLYGELSPLLLTAEPLVFQGLSATHMQVAAMLMNAEPAWEEASALLLTQLLLYLARQERAPVHTEELDDMRRLARLEQLLNERFTENVTLEEVAQQLCVSQRQASRIIRRYYGATLREVVTDNRLTLAAHLLRTTAMSLLQVSATVGFGAAATFQSAFRRKYGVSPREYREQT